MTRSFAAFRRILSPPSFPDFEKTQKARLLHVALAAAAVGSIPMGVINLGQGATSFAWVLFALAALSLAGLALNVAGRTRLAVVFLEALIYAASVFTIVDGAGLSDPGVLAFPILILLATFYFGGRGALVSTVLAVGTLLVLRLLSLEGVLPTAGYGASRMIISSILLVTLAVIGWVVAAAWERSLFELREARGSLEMAIEGAHSAVFDLDIPTGRIEMNSPWVGPGGIYPPRATVDEWEENLHPDDRQQAVAGLEACLRGATPAWSADYRARGMTGEWEWRMVLGRVTTRDPSGRPLRMSGVVLDMSEMRRTEENLLASERRYRLLSRDLHDSVTQTLYSLRLTLEAARLALERDRTHTAELLAQVDSLAKSALDEMRALLRQARPEALEQQGLVAALRDHIAALRARDELEVDYQVHGDRELTVDQELSLFRAAQEALSNVSKHSGVKRASLRLELQGDPLVLEVQDHGCGLPPEPSRARPGGLGLTTMRERVEALGGTLSVESDPGRGTRLRFEVPRAGPGSHG
jgi:signal transduction histidine kinase